LARGRVRMRWPVAVKTGGGIAGFKEMDVDQGRGPVHADGFVIVKIGLRDAAFLDTDFVAHARAESFDDRTLGNVFRGTGIDDLTANIATTQSFSIFTCF
jgi:hypothetical protein